MVDHVKCTYFDELAPRWDSLPAPADKMEEVARFCKLACPRPAARILDVGSGTGILAPHVLEDSVDGFRLVELDFAISMLRESARKHRDRPIWRICGDALRLPFADNGFDAVLCFGVFPHLGKPGPAAEELWRIVQPGGVLAVGHPMGSARLNALHGGIGGPVVDDMLLPAAELAGMLRILGAESIEAVDTPQRYFVRAKKGAR